MCWWSEDEKGNVGKREKESAGWRLGLLAGSFLSRWRFIFPLYFCLCFLKFKISTLSPHQPKCKWLSCVGARAFYGSKRQVCWERTWPHKILIGSIQRHYSLHQYCIEPLNAFVSRCLASMCTATLARRKSTRPGRQSGVKHVFYTASSLMTRGQFQGLRTETSGGDLLQFIAMLWWWPSLCWVFWLSRGQNNSRDFFFCIASWKVISWMT